MIIQSWFNRPRSTPEVMPCVSRVERVGYRSAKQQIESFMQAGERLAAYRAVEFDCEDGVLADPDNMDIDPTRRPGLDMAEATALQRDVRARLADQRRAIAAARQQQTQDKVDQPLPTKTPPRIGGGGYIVPLRLI